jgi:phenylpropionate dioxygenase-like ring-hydroxylating dioxygenase large terminal subunit
MIPKQWYAIARSQEIKTHQIKSLVRLGEKLVLWRDRQNRVVCMKDRCCHRGMALSAGRVVQGCIECPYHGLQFDSEGHCQRIPANGEQAPIPQGFVMTTYPIQEAHGFIWMWWGDVPETLPSLPWFEELETCFSAYTSPPMTLAVHYSRAVENLLDIAHLPILPFISFWILH